MSTIRQHCKHAILGEEKVVWGLRCSYRRIGRCGVSRGCRSSRSTVCNAWLHYAVRILSKSSNSRSAFQVGEPGAPV